MFANKAAVDRGEGQQIDQLSKTWSPELATTVMSFSGAQDGPAKAVKWLNVKFNSPHLLLPRVYQEIREIAPARTQNEVPQVAERLLRKVESISALMDGDSKSLPADVTQVIFQALNLSMQEKKEVLYLLEDDRGVTIAVMRDYIANCFKTNEIFKGVVFHQLRIPDSSPGKIQAEAYMIFIAKIKNE